MSVEEYKVGDLEDRVGGVGGLNRRTLLKKGALSAAVAVGTATVLDSFVSPAAAAGSQSYTRTTYNSAVETRAIPAGRTVSYVISGAGGGGGADTTGTYSYTGGAGGAGTKLTGTIPAQGSPYTLYIAVGEKGAGGIYNTGTIVDNGGSLYGQGGLGGEYNTTVVMLLRRIGVDEMLVGSSGCGLRPFLVL